jgi:hypothetical protein
VVVRVGVVVHLAGGCDPQGFADEGLDVLHGVGAHLLEEDEVVGGHLVVGGGGSFGDFVALLVDEADADADGEDEDYCSGDRVFFPVVHECPVVPACAAGDVPQRLKPQGKEFGCGTADAVPLQG